MIRKITLLISIAFLSFPGFAQDEEERESGFKKENLFTGGSFNVSFFNGATILGVSPHFGYRLADWVDAGIVVNYTYSGFRDYQQFDDKLRQHTYGGGLFTRVYPVNFLFAQAQFEKNFSTVSYTPSTSAYQPYKENYSANSFLVGGGYAQGRYPGSNTFFYLSLLFDVIKDVNSPYVDVAVDPNTGAFSVRAIPLIRAGFNIGLFEGRYRR